MNLPVDPELAEGLLIAPVVFAVIHVTRRTRAQLARAETAHDGVAAHAPVLKRAS